MLSTARRASSCRNATASAGRLEHPGGHAFVHPAGDVREGGVEQPQLGAGGHERRAVEQSPRVGRQARGARQDRVAHRRRHRVAGRRQQLGHEERVAAGQRVDGVGVVTGCELAHGLDRQRRDRDALDRRRRRQVAEQAAQRMVADRLVVAVGDEHERRRRAHPAADHAQHVERRLVGPVHVLEHEHGRETQLVEQRARDAPRVAPRVDVRGQRAADLVGDVGERSERSGRRQVLAGAEPHGHVEPGGERADQRGLPHAGLAAHQQQLPALALGRRQLRQQGVTFDQPGHPCPFWSIPTQGGTVPLGFPSATGGSARRSR